MITGKKHKTMSDAEFYKLELFNEGLKQWSESNLDNTDDELSENDCAGYTILYLGSRLIDLEKKVEALTEKVDYLIDQHKDC
jgi:hypothetical protein